MLKRYKINPDVKKYLRRVLVLARCKFRIRHDEDGNYYCYINLTSNHFHKLVLRARCEKATEETGMLHVTFEESCNEAFVTYLMAQRGVHSYAVVGDPSGKMWLEWMYGDRK